MVAGAQREPARLDWAAARAPFLERGGDARLAAPSRSSHSRAGWARIWPLGVDDDGRDRRAPVRLAWIRSSSSDRLDSRSEPPRTAPTWPSGANTGIVRMTIGSPETRDDGTPVDHRPLVAQRVPEVLAVGDVGAWVVRAPIVADRENGAVEGDDEDARKERRQHRLPLQQVVQARRLGERCQRHVQGDAAQARAARRRAAARSSPRGAARRLPATPERSARWRVRPRAARRRPSARCSTRISDALARARRTLSEPRLNVSRAVRIHGFSVRARVFRIRAGRDRVNLLARTPRA